jgi:hypothetical protein
MGMHPETPMETPLFTEYGLYQYQAIPVSPGVQSSMGAAIVTPFDERQSDWWGFPPCKQGILPRPFDTCGDSGKRRSSNAISQRVIRSGVLGGEATDVKGIVAVGQTAGLANLHDESHVSHHLDVTNSTELYCK